MTKTFGRRTASDRAPARPPASRPQPTTPVLADPRVEAFAATLRTVDQPQDELRDYLARRRAAIGLKSWVADGLYIAPALASYGLGLPWPWLIPISAASYGARTPPEAPAPALGRAARGGSARAGQRLRRYSSTSKA